MSGNGEHLQVAVLIAPSESTIRMYSLAIEKPFSWTKLGIVDDLVGTKFCRLLLFPRSCQKCKVVIESTIV